MKNVDLCENLREMSFVLKHSENRMIALPVGLAFALLSLFVDTVEASKSDFLEKDEP